VTRRGWASFIALGIIWGLPYLLIKISVREISPPLLVLIRTGGGALVFVPLASLKGVLVPALRRWRAILLYTAAELGVPWLLLFSAERRLPSSLTGLLIAAVPLAAAVLAWLTGSDRVDLRRLAGLLLGLAGVGALVGFDVGGSQVLAVLSLLVVAAGYALGPWIAAHRLSDVPPIGVMAWSFTFCAAAYAPIAAFFLPNRALSASVVESAVGLTVVCTIVAFLVFFSLIREVGAMRTTLITYINPAVAVVLGVTVLGERFRAATGVGFVLILGGCLLATRPVAQRVDHTPGEEIALPHPPSGSFGADSGALPPP
jgi:drug/metabolite transporter (DMT)-like permease